MSKRTPDVRDRFWAAGGKLGIIAAAALSRAVAAFKVTDYLIG